MDSFFKTVKTSFNSRENIIKQTILTNLAESAKEMQFDYRENGHETMILNDCTSSFCTIIESLYLHGLKDSFIRQTINVFAGGDIDRRPEPNFWPLLLIISHKQIIEQIQSMSQLNADIGYCRAWIRQTLNDGLLSSYLNTIRKNSSFLKPYYQRYAFLRDNDTMEVAEKIIEGIEICIKFDLPCNSSLLNYWADNSLQMAGIWVSPIRSCHIASGVDIVNTLTDDELQLPSTPQKRPKTPEIYTEAISTYSKHSTIHKNLTEDEHLDMFLNKIDEMEIISDLEIVDEAEENNEEDEKITLHEQQQQMTSSIKSQNNMGNSIISKIGWSSVDDDNDKDNNDNIGVNNDDNIENDDDVRNNRNSRIISRSNSMTTSGTSLKLTLDKLSYNTLLAKHQNLRQTRQINLNDLWQRFESSLGIADDIGIIGINNTTSEDSVHLAEELEFVEVPSVTDKFSIQELQLMVEQSCKLAREPGLDAQGYICKSCAIPICIGFSKAQVCSFSGNYYCDSCMSPEMVLIPSKIIYNWDFKKYPVSLVASSFLIDFQYQPFIDFKLLNPDIYTAVNEMAILQSLRIQLSFIRAYLFTCCEPIIEKLQKQIWTKEYLHEHIHRYSIADLTLIQKGNLIQLLQKTVQFGQEHIRECSLCSQKGFICEVCNSPKVLYPFDITTTYRCENCGSVFHCDCLNSSQPCPKCDRKKKREDLPLLDIS